jgi:hypothetical protein
VPGMARPIGTVPGPSATPSTRPVEDQTVVSVGP